MIPFNIQPTITLPFNQTAMRSFLPKPTGNANPITGLPNFQTAYNGVCKTSLNNFVQKLKIAIGRIIAVFFILIFAAAFSENIFAQTAGPNLAGAGATSGGTGTGWSNPDRVTANDNSYTSVSGTGTAFSEGLQATNFGFSIPAAATITGIQVTIGRYQSTGSGTADIQDNAVSLIQGGTVGGSNRGATSINWPTSEGAATYGTTTDLWGRTWTPAQINASNFGVELRVDNTSGFRSRTAYVDYMTITVTYTCATPAQPSAISRRNNYMPRSNSIVQCNKCYGSNL